MIMITISVWGRHYKFMSHRPSPIVQDSAFPTVTVKDIEEEREGTRSEKDRVIGTMCTDTYHSHMVTACCVLERLLGVNLKAQMRKSMAFFITA